MAARDSDEMMKLLPKCNKLPTWAKQQISNGWGGLWGEDEGYGHMIEGTLILAYDLTMNNITSLGAIKLFDSLREMKSSIGKLYLGGNSLDDTCIQSLGEYIRNNKNIEAISIGNKVSNNGVTALLPYFEDNTTFKYMSFSGNVEITDKSVPLLMKMVEAFNVEGVGIRSTSITDKNCFLGIYVKNQLLNKTDKLNLGLRGVDDKEMIKICSMMKTYGIDHVKEVNVFESLVTSKGAIMLFDTLKDLKAKVKKIDFNKNQLRDDCLGSLGEYLQDNEYLEHLRLDGNLLSDPGIMALSEYLNGNTGLKVLDISWTRDITDVCVPYLVSVAQRSSIKEIKCDGTCISDESKQIIDELLNIPIDEREIPIKSNTKSAAKIST